MPGKCLMGQNIITIIITKSRQHVADIALRCVTIYCIMVCHITMCCGVLHHTALWCVTLYCIIVQDTSSGGGKVKQTKPSYTGRMMLTQTAEPSDEAIILPTSSVDITDVSRMGFDLRRKAVVGDRNKVDPDQADKRFVELLVQLLEKVCMLLCHTSLCVLFMTPSEHLMHHLKDPTATAILSSHCIGLVFCCTYALAHMLAKACMPCLLITDDHCICTLPFIPVTRLHLQAI